MYKRQPIQQNNLKELKPIRLKFFNFLRYRVNDRRMGVNLQAYDLDTGKSLMDQIKVIVKRIEQHEQGLLKMRTDNSQRYGNYSSILIIVASLIAIIITVLMVVRILKDYKERSLLQEELLRRDAETAERIKAISSIASQLSDGDYSISVTDNQSDALGSVGVSLNNMGKSLKKSFELLSHKEWLQTGIAQLNNIMLGEKKLSILTKDIIEFVAVYSNSSAGLIYTVEGDELVKAAGYSYIPSKSQERLKMGQGITGQAAISRKIISLDQLSDTDIAVSYGLGEVKPSQVIAVPLLDNKVEGVIELASVKGFTSIQIEFLTSVASNIGIAIKATQNRKRVIELLEETQSQSEELRLQHSEMEAINAELETQTEKLQASDCLLYTSPSPRD